MKEITLTVEDYVYDFYKKVGEQADGRSPEQVMSDALFKFAGSLSVNILKDQNTNLNQ